jgi:integrase
MFDDFQRKLRLEGYKESTIAKKIENLTILNKHTGLDCKLLSSYLENSKLKGSTSAYLNKLIATVKQFNPDCEIPFFKRDKRPPVKSMFSEEELKKFFSVSPSRGQSQKDFDKYFTFFYSLMLTGCRPNEIGTLSLTGSNRLDLGSKTIYLTDTKTINREVPIVDPLYRVLTTYITKYQIKDRLFTKMKRNNWESAFNRWIKKANIPKRQGLNSYSFRRSFITHSLQSGSNLLDIADIVGHQSAESTQHYYSPSRKARLVAINKLPALRYLKSNHEILNEIYGILDEIVSNTSETHFKTSLFRNGQCVHFEIKMS